MQFGLQIHFLEELITANDFLVVEPPLEHEVIFDFESWLEILHVFVSRHVPFLNPLP